MSRRRCEFTEADIRAAAKKMKALCGSPELHREHDRPLMVIITAAEAYLPKQYTPPAEPRRTP